MKLKQNESFENDLTYVNEHKDFFNFSYIIYNALARFQCESS